MTQNNITGIKILKDTNGMYYGMIEDEILTDKEVSIDEVAEKIDMYYYNLFSNSGYTTSYKVHQKKKEPKKHGIVATVTVKLIEL